MNISFTPEKSKNIIKIDDLKDYAVLFNALTAETMGLNLTGLLIWEKINGKRTTKDIIKVMISEFSVELERAEDDVTDLIRRLDRRMFIKFKEQNRIEPGESD